MIPIEIQPILWTIKHLSELNRQLVITEQKYFTHLLTVNGKLISTMIARNVKHYGLNIDNESAQDYRQETLFVVWECLLTYDPEHEKQATFYTYLLSKVNYMFHNTFFRQQQKEKQYETYKPLEEFTDLPDDRPLNLSTDNRLSKVRVGTIEELQGVIHRQELRSERKMKERKALKALDRKVKEFDKLSKRQQNRRLREYVENQRKEQE